MSSRDIGSQNLSALQRLDNKIYGVLGNSKHVSVYIFDDQNKQWARKDVEGSLFVVSRTEYPFAKLVVMNRLNMKNLVEDISEKLVIKVQGPYLIYKNNTEEINGIWFYESDDKDRIFALLKEVQSKPPQPMPPPQHVYHQPTMMHPPGFVPPFMAPPFMGPTPGNMNPHMPMPPYNGPPPHIIQQQQPIPPQQQQVTVPEPELELPKDDNQNNPHNNVPIMLAKLMNSAKITNNDSNNNNEESSRVTKEEIRDRLKELINDDAFITLIYNYYNKGGHE